MDNIKSFLRGPKIIFAVLAVIILAEVVLALRYLGQRNSSSTTFQEISGGKIILVTTKKDIKVGDIVSVDVRVSTGGHSTEGTDLVLKFDPKAVEILSGKIVPGKIYGEYPMKSVDPKLGQIRISGIAGLVNKTSFNGIGVFATLNFKAVKPGKTTLSVDFTPKKTSDSNIIDSQTTQDILEGVTNLDLNIK